jgi:hypothetical protein
LTRCCWLSGSSWAAGRLGDSRLRPRAM